MSMPSYECEQALIDIQRTGRALLKTISPNDTGSTGAHQSGYYLPKAAWRIFSPSGPRKGENFNHPVNAVWPDGRSTDSMVKWYGVGSRSEFRMTRFGRSFPYLNTELVGSVLILVPETPARFRMHILVLPEDVDDLEAALGIDLLNGWAAYEENAIPQEVSEESCIERRFDAFVALLHSFPPGAAISNEARSALIECGTKFVASGLDHQLMACLEAEFELFQRVERKVCTPQTVRAFQSIDQFIKTANSILQRRKARAGRSLENQVHAILTAASIPHEMGPVVDRTRPDIVIPGSREYLDNAWPVKKLFVIGVKRTCKDRWRQVTREAPRVRRKHILTIQNGISTNQLEEIRSSGIELIVPKDLHRHFRKADRSQLVSVDRFVEDVKKALAR